MAKHAKVIQLIREKVRNQECRIEETGKLLFITTWEVL